MGKVKEVFSGTGRFAGRSYEKFMEGPKTSPFSWIGRFILALIKWAFFIGVLILIYLFLTGAFKSGLSEYGKERATEAIQKTPFLSDTLAKATEFFKIVKDPSKSLREPGFKGEVDESSEESGLKFENIKSLKRSYLKDDEEIIVISTIKVTTLDENMKIRLSCNATTHDIPGKVDMGNGLKDYEEVTFEKNSNTIFTLECIIPLKDNNDKIKFSGEEKIKPERIVISAEYNFKTKAYVESFTMSASLLKQKQYNSEEIFENEFNSRLNKKTGEIKSKYSKGPIGVLINTDTSQPFTEKGPFGGDSYYTLRVLTKPVYTSFQGRLNKINNVYLSLPDNFEILEDNKNDFESYDEGNAFNLDEEIKQNYRIFKLKRKTLDEINLYCNKRDLNELECEAYWKSSLILGTTKFRITQLDKEELDKNFINVQANYEFKSETSTTPSIIKYLSLEDAKQS